MMSTEVVLSELTPTEYFEGVKDKKIKCTDELLDSVYSNCLSLLNKYSLTGQKEAMRKLIFHLENVERERELVKCGIDTFVYKEDIVDYIKNVASNVVKVIELKNYEREIPDDIVDIITKTKDIFTDMYVVYTDYTRETEKRVAMDLRAKDPILFGAFTDRATGVVVERFYYLGDWEDEYCSLTLDRLVADMSAVTNRKIVHTISTPADIQELKAQLKGVKVPKEEPKKKWYSRFVKGN